MNIKGNTINIQRMLIFFFIALLGVIQTRIEIIEFSTCDDAVCLKNLKDYVLALNSMVACSKTGDKFHTSISHTKPHPGCSAFYVQAYTSTFSGKLEIVDISKELIGDKLYINLGLTVDDIQDERKCKQIGTDPNHFIRQCEIVLEYGGIQGLMIKEYSYAITVKVPRSVNVDFSIIGTPILERGCDCEYITNAKYRVTLFKGDCTTEIPEGSSIQYGQDVCLFVAGDDDLTRRATFEATQLIATYTIEGGGTQNLDMLGVTRIRCSLEYICTPGQIYMIVPIINIGRLRFSSVIVLNGLRRQLEVNVGSRKGIQTVSPEYTVDNASYLGGIAMILLALLSLIL